MSARLIWTAIDGRVRIVERITELPYGAGTTTDLVMEQTTSLDALGVMRWQEVPASGAGHPQVRPQDLAELLVLAGLVQPEQTTSLSCPSCQIGEHGACEGPTCHCACA